MSRGGRGGGKSCVKRRRRQGLVEGEERETKGLFKEIKGRGREMKKIRHDDIEKDEEKASVKRRRRKVKRNREEDT